MDPEDMNYEIEFDGTDFDMEGGGFGVEGGGFGVEGPDGAGFGAETVPSE